MALGTTQPLTEMSTRNILGGKGRPVRKADNLTAIYEPIVCKMWEPRRLTNLWAFTACYRDSFAFLLFLFNVNDAVGSSAHRASNDRMINKLERIGEERGSWPNSKYNSGTFLE
jgi:hypothetical protein